jgi:hypothetical protein
LRQNIEKAKKKIEEIEKAEANANGVDEVTEGVKETSLQDKQES